MNAGGSGPARDAWASELAGLETQALLRVLRPVTPAGPASVRRGGRALVNFSSNDYLGLAAHPAVIESAARAARDYGAGSTASRLVCGSLPPHTALERRLAAFKRTEAALGFACGYSTALGTVPALVGRGDVVVLDKRAHACLVDGARLSGARLRVFPHNDLDRLDAQLAWARRTHPHARVLVITESVFSMDGDLAPLDDIVRIKDAHGAWLLLDEAHATGVIGPAGRGLAAQLGVADRIEVQMGTLGKAAGVAGGYVCGARSLVDLLVNRARSFLFSTAPPPAQAAAAETALGLLEGAEGATRRDRLHDRARRLAAIVPGAPLPPPSPIVPWHIGAESRALEAAAHLETAGFLAPAIRFPTVARGAARVRLTACADHTPDQIAALAVAVAGFPDTGA